MISPSTFDFIYEYSEFSNTTYCASNEVFTSASSSMPQDGVHLSYSGNVFSVYGKYTGLFDLAVWTYIPFDRENTVTVHNYEFIPSVIKTLVYSERDPGVEKLVTYTLTTLETVITYTEETAYNTSVDAETGEVTYIPYTYTVAHTNYYDHTYNITQRICNAWDTYNNQLNNVIARGRL